jgi:UDP-N-acetyl-D-mannosaminuronic acid dehydrogenase
MKHDICIIGGLGHVGLPLGLAFAQQGQKVVLYDINKTALDLVSQGKMPFLELGAEKVLQNVLGRTLSVTSDSRVISQGRFVVVVIGTPVDEHLNPMFTLFKKFIDGFMDLLSDDQHLILRSTVYPGVTEKIQHYFLSKGKKIRLSFCPERIVQGQALHEIAGLPQIVASFDDRSFEEAAALFRIVTPDIVRLTPPEAELAKLFNNVWRYIQFAISNQFYTIAAENGLDFYRIHQAMTYKYPRAQSMPSAGFAAGPCLFKDTMQLAAYSGNQFFLGHSAMLVNEGLPYFILQHLKTAHNLRKKTVGILGMAFKANSDDKRESLSYKMKHILEAEAENVLCSDVYIRDEGFVPPPTLIERSDIIILATPHKEYKELRFKDSQVVVDIWNYYGKGGLF